jgi:3,4-dihydroxybenzoyl-citryl-spermidine/N-citryl-spermidine--spermidine ligase
MQQLTKRIEYRVIRQVIEAMIFEELIPYKEEIMEDGSSIYYLYGKKNIYQCKGKRTAFDRIRLEEESLINIELEMLVDELISQSGDKSRFMNELEQTIILCTWNEANLLQPISRRASCYEELESEIGEGHPYHPCFKSRTGFTVEDHAQYGPEAKNSFQLQWIAVRRNKVRVCLLEDEQTFWINELGQQLWELFLEELLSLGGTFDEYTFLPVHPWQWENLDLKGYIQHRDIVPLNACGDMYRATQSVRTLWNETNPGKAYIKLPLNMVNTSSLRNLNVHSVCAAPSISRWIQEVIQSDVYLRKEASLRILEEYTGIIFESEEKKLEGQLGVIWRENIRQYINEEEEAIPFTALIVMEHDGRPFIDEWISQYGLEKWLHRFIEVSIIPVWHLLIAHGIAVEAHAQNMILLHKDGWPTRVVLRDFHESVEYNEGFLADTSILPIFNDIHECFKSGEVDEYYWMSSVEALRELIMDTLFVFHLSELSHLIEEQYGYNEENFWKKVSTAIDKHMERFPALVPRNEQLEHSKKQIYVESLLTRKIKNQEGSYRHLVRNIFNNE